MEMNLTASSVDAFDDWFSKLDDNDLDLTPPDAKVSPNKTNKNAISTDLDDSWVDSSDDEHDKARKPKSPRRELKPRKSGDLERMFMSAASAVKPTSERASSAALTSPDGRKLENKALKLLNEDDKKKAKKALERRRCVKEDTLRRRNSISQCMERQLSGSSSGSGGASSDKVGSPSQQNRSKRVLTPPRSKRSPMKNKCDAVKPALLSALYGSPIRDNSVDATEANESDEGISSSFKAEEKVEKEELEGTDGRKQQLPSRRSPSAGGLRDRSRDSLSRSRHGAYGRSTDMDPSRRSVPRDSRRRDDPLSRSSHEPGQCTSHDRSLPRRSRHGVSHSSSIDPSTRRRTPQDPLSRSCHGTHRPLRGSSVGPSRRFCSEDNQEQRASISQSSHGTSRHSSFEDSTISRRSAGLSSSIHGPSRHQSYAENTTARRMPKGSLSRPLDSSRPNESDRVKIPTRSRSSTRPPRRSHDQSVPRSRSGSELHTSSHPIETPIRIDDEELLRAAISMLQSEELALSSVEPRERNQRRERSHNDSDLRRSSHGKSRRSKTPTRL